MLRRCLEALEDAADVVAVAGLFRTPNRESRPNGTAVGDRVRVVWRF
jgi:hypothetical protein